MIEGQKKLIVNVSFAKIILLVFIFLLSNNTFAASVSDIPVRYFSQNGDMCDSCSNNQTSVRYLQMVLNSDSQLNLSPKLLEDGIWGNNTKNAVKSFQSKYSLSPVDGWVGATTKARLDVVLARIKLTPVEIPDAPTKPVASDNLSDKIRITWSLVPRANNYKIYRSNALFSYGTQLAAPLSSSTTSYNDTTATVGITYYYWLKACLDYECSGFSPADDGYRTSPSSSAPRTPSAPSATDGTYTDKVVISWSKVPDADQYKVYRSTSSSNNGSLLPISLSGSASSVTDVTANAGTKYYYRVQACRSGLCSGFSAYDDGYRKSASEDTSIWINPKTDLPYFSIKQKQMYQAYLYGVSPILNLERSVGIEFLRDQELDNFNHTGEALSGLQSSIDYAVAGMSVGESRTKLEFLGNLATETSLLALDDIAGQELASYAIGAGLDIWGCSKLDSSDCFSGSISIPTGAITNVAKVFNAINYWGGYSNITKKQMSYMIAEAYILSSIRKDSFEPITNSLIKNIADKIGIDTGWVSFSRDYDQDFAVLLLNRYKSAIESTYDNFPTEYPPNVNLINQRPNKPNLQIQGGNISNISLTPTFLASNWGDPDQNDTHAETWWGIREYNSGNYVFDSGWSSSNKYSISVSSSVGLQKGMKYQAVVAFMDNHGAYSNARFVTFTTESDPNNKPQTPVIDVDGGVNDTSLTPTLNTSSFNDQDPGDAHDATWWEIRKTGSVIWNSDWDKTNLTSIKIPSGILDLETTYTVYVRHRDSRSSISGLGSVTFTTKSAIGADNKPDLAVINVSVSNTTPTVGESIQLEADIKNIGSATATSTHTRYFVSTDSSITISDTEVDNETTSSLDAGEADFERETFSAPVTSGTYWVGMCVDTVSDESNTSNNCSEGLKIIVKEPTGYLDDFSFELVSLDKTTVEAGGTLALYAKEEYAGNRTVDRVENTIAYLLRSQNDSSIPDIYLGDDVGVPSNGSTSGKRETVTIPINTKPGLYYIVFIADYPNEFVETNENNNTEIVAFEVTENTSASFNYDIDGDGLVQPLTDGLLNLRYQFGFRGDSLVDGAVSPNATRNTSDEIETYLIEGGLSLDIDGDGEIKPLTDGLLVLRYLFEFRGDTLINNAIDENSTRTTSLDIESQIQSLMP